MKKVFVAALMLCANLPAWAEESTDAQIKQGEYLARAGDCVACHTAKGGKPFAGGLGMETPAALAATALMTLTGRCAMGLARVAAACIPPCHFLPTHVSARPTCKRSTRTS